MCAKSDGIGFGCFGFDEAYQGTQYLSNDFLFIMPTIGMISVLTFVGNFNAFDLVYVIEGALASPNFSTDLMGTLFYRTFFGQQLQLEDPMLGATVATMMFFIILVGVLIYTFAWQRRVTVYDL